MTRSCNPRLYARETFYRDAGLPVSQVLLTAIRYGVCGLQTVGGDKIFEIKPGDTSFETYYRINYLQGVYTFYLDYNNADGGFYRHELQAYVRKDLFIEKPGRRREGIRSIVSKDADGNTSNTERFVYDESGTPTGHLLTPLRYVHLELITMDLAYQRRGRIRQVVQVKAADGWH